MLFRTHNITIACALVLTLPPSSLADTRFYPDTGKLDIGSVVIDDQDSPYSVVLAMQGDKFVLESAAQIGTQVIGLEPAIFNSGTGALSLPTVLLGEDSYSVTMNLVNDQFVLDTAVPTTGVETLWAMDYQFGKFSSGVHYHVEFNGGAVATDGGMLAVGTAQFNDDDGLDAFLIKTDSSGNSQWTRAVHVTTYNERVSRVLALDNGNLLIAGTEAVETSLSSFPERNPAVFLMEIDQEANVIWQQTYSIDASGNEFKDLAVAADGGYFLLADPSSLSSNTSYVIRVDNSGVQQWSKSYSPQIFWADFSFTAITQADSGFAVFGTHGHNDAGNYTAYAVSRRYDNEGILIDEVQYPTDDVSTLQRVSGAVTASDGAFYTIGEKRIGGWVAKYDSQGQLQWNAWVRAPDADNRKTVYLYRLRLLDNGDLLVAGSNWASSFFNFDLDASIARINNRGTVLWQKVFSNEQFDDSERFADIVPVGDNQFLGIGSFNSTQVTDSGDEYSRSRGYLSLIQN